MPEQPNHKDVLNFWYSDKVRGQWFSSTAGLDTEIRDRFEPLWLQAAQGRLHHWQHAPESTLALILVLDQFPLNMYRGQTRSFSTEASAVQVTRDALRQGFDKALPTSRLAFLYMPLMHSEALADQDLAVELFTAAGLDDNAKFARHHRDIVQRFGRFPHRNQALGRTSSDEERAWLASPEGYQG